MRYRPYMLLICLTASCIPRRTLNIADSSAQTEAEWATTVAAELREGMTFAQVSQIIQLDETRKLGAAHHGGQWYDVPVADGFYVQLRFERALVGQDPSSRIMNLPPRVKRRPAASCGASESALELGVSGSVARVSPAFTNSPSSVPHP